MKRIILIAGLILTVSFVSHARRIVAEGETYSTMGKYMIQMGDKCVTIDGKQHVPFVITYENSDLEVRVAIDMDKRTKRYYVISDNLSVQYVSNRHYFGVERLNKELEKDGFSTCDTFLNRGEYFRQKVITSKKSWRQDNTKLIAAYFPMLLNDNENKLAVK